MGTTVLLGTHDIDLLPNASHIIALGKNGRVADCETVRSLNHSSAYISSLTIRDRSIKHKLTTMDQVMNQTTVEFSPEEETTLPETIEDSTRRLGDSSMYKYLFSRIGTWKIFLFTIFQCGWAVSSTIGPVWLQFWADASTSTENRNPYYLGVYAAFQILALPFRSLFSGHTLTTIGVKIGSS